MNILSRPRKIFFLLGLLFLFTRLYNLTLLPIFTDEAVYIYWAKHIATYNTNWFISLTDGNPPLFTWIAAFLLKIFPEGMYLFAGRLVSVIAGGIGLIGIYRLSLLLFRDSLTGYLAVFLYIISPFTLFYDRIALYDSLLSALLVWSVYYACRASETLAKKHVVLWGIFLGLGLLTKSSAVFFLALTPICFILLTNKKNIKKNVNKIALLLLLTVIIALTLYSIQLISPLYQSIPAKAQHFQIPLSTLIANPFGAFNSNISKMYNWLVFYYTFPVLLIGCVGLILLLKKNATKGTLLVLLWIVPILGFAVIGKILFPRYILFTTPYLLISAAYVLSIILSKTNLRIQIGIVSIILFFSTQVNWSILINPPKAPLPVIDYSQYISSKNSGYGLDIIFSFLDKELATGPQITLMTQGEFGLFPYAFKLHYWNEKRIVFFTEKISYKQDISAMQKSSKVYAIFWDSELLPENFREVLRVKKPDGKYPIILATPK